MRPFADTCLGDASRVIFRTRLCGVADGDGDGAAEEDLFAPWGSGKASGLVVGSPLGMIRRGLLVACGWELSMPLTLAAASATTLITPPITSATASSAATLSSSCLGQEVSSSSVRAMHQGCGTGQGGVHPAPPAGPGSRAV